MQKLGITIPSFTHLSLAFCLKCTFSLNINSSYSSLLNILCIESLGDRSPSSSIASMLGMLVKVPFSLIFNPEKRLLIPFFQFGFIKLQLPHQLMPFPPVALKNSSPTSKFILGPWNLDGVTTCSLIEIKT